MKKRDANRLRMIGSTIAYCEKHSSAAAGVPAFAVVLGKVKAKREEISQLYERTSSTSRGVTADMKALRQQMSELAVKCGSAGLAYFNSISNHTLAEQLNVTEYDLEKMKKEDVDDVCQQIKDVVAANMVALADWGVTAGDVAALQGAIDAYRHSMPNPRLAIVSRSQANKKVAALIREVIDELLEKQLDRLADTLKAGNLNFWYGYRMAREIIDLGVTHAKVRGSVRDAGDMPLEGAQFVIYEAGTQKVVMRVLSAKNGKFKASPLPTGYFDFIWELAGYAVVREENVRIALGKELKRKVVMRKLAS
jgi:hypothetical protein